MTYTDSSLGKYAQTEKLLTSSGCKCAVGCTEKSNLYFVFRGLTACDGSGIKWYINLGIESDGKSKKRFIRIIRKILLDFDSFKNAVQQWFIATPDEAFSYGIDYDGVEEFFSQKEDISVDEIEFFGLNYPQIKQFSDMISDIDNQTPDCVFMLTLETTASYFYRQNPYFVGKKIRYMFEYGTFIGLISQDEDTLKKVLEAKQKKKSQQTSSKERTVDDGEKVFELLKENRHTIELVCKVTVGTLAVVGAGILIKKILS